MQQQLLSPHQIKAIGELHNGSILRGGVGTGKSRTALGYFVQRVCLGDVYDQGGRAVRAVERPRDLYIITTAKKRDSLEWNRECARFGITTVRDDSDGGLFATIDSWNNIGRYIEVSNAFFIFDEQRLVGSGAWVKAFLAIAKRNNWILLSATPGDTWSDYAPVFIANGFYRNKTEFATRHVVLSRFSKFPKVDRYIDTEILEKHKAMITVEMPFEGHTRRHVQNIMVDYDKDLYDRVSKDRWHIYEDRPLRDVAELFIVMRKLVNGDVSRLGAVMQLWEKHPRLIIFYNFDYELKMLRTLADVLHAPMAEWNGHKHEEIPEDNSWIYLVQYTAGSEGWNCVLTDAMVFYSLNYSYRIMEQAKGRIDRMNTPYFDLQYYVLRSMASIDTAINKALAQKRTFNEKELKL